MLSECSWAGGRRVQRWTLERVKDAGLSSLAAQLRQLRSCTCTDLSHCHVSSKEYAYKPCMDSFGRLLDETQAVSLAEQSGSPITIHSPSQSSTRAIKGCLCCPRHLTIKEYVASTQSPSTYALHSRAARNSSANGLRHPVPTGFYAHRVAGT